MVDLAERPATDDAPPGYRMTKLGLLPEEWRVVRLGDVAGLQLGRTPARARSEYWGDGEVPWVSIADLKNGRIERTREAVSGRAFDEVFRGRLVPAGTLLLSFKLTIGKVGILATGAVHNEAIASLTLSPEVDRDFLFFLLQATDFGSSLDSYVKGKTLNKDKLQRFLLPLPPLPEQRAIAQVLSTVQRAREATEAVIAATRELKRSLMRHLFTYGPVPADQVGRVLLKETEIGAVPLHWEVQRLADLATLFSGGTPAKQQPEWWTGPLPWASPKDLKVPRLSDTEDHISIEAAAQGSRIVEAGSILVVVRGMILARDVPIALVTVPMAFNQDLKAIVPDDNVLPEYLLYALEYFKSHLSREIGTSAHGTRRLGTSALEGFLVPLPTEGEQTAIRATLRAVDAALEANEVRKRTLDVLFHSALRGLMTGIVRVIAEHEAEV